MVEDPREPYKLVPIKAKGGGEIWYMRYVDPQTGRRNKHSTGIRVEDRNKLRADTIAANKWLEITQGHGKAKRLEDYTAGFFKWAPGASEPTCPWVKRQHSKGRSFSEYQAHTRRAHLDNYIIPQFGRKRLDELTQPMVERWLDTLSLSGQTKNHIAYTLRIILREAKRERLIRENPLQEPEPFAKNPRQRDVLTMDELRLLFPRKRDDLLAVWKTPEHAALYMTMVTTGIRSGEARALQWRHVLPTGWLHVAQAVKMGGGIGETKTGKDRVIALPSRTREVLEWWHSESPFGEPDHLVFHGTSAEKPLHVQTVTNYFAKTIKRLNDEAAKKKLPPVIRTEGRVLVVHGLRHTYNTLMRQVLPEEVLRRFTGHKTPEMTEHYDHPALEDQMKKLEGARPIVDAVWK